MSNIHKGWVALAMAMSLNAASATVVTHQFSAVLNYFNGDLTTLDLSAPTNVLSGTFTYDTDLQKIDYAVVHTYQHVGSPAAYSAELFLNGAPLAQTGNQTTLAPCLKGCSGRSLIRQTNEELSDGAQDDVSFRYSFFEAGNALRPTTPIQISPVPESSTALQLLIGLGRLGWVAARSRKASR